MSKLISRINFQIHSMHITETEKKSTFLKVRYQEGIYYYSKSLIIRMTDPIKTSQ